MRDPFANVDIPADYVSPTLEENMVGNAQAALRPGLGRAQVRFFLRQSARCAADIAKAAQV